MFRSVVAVPVIAGVLALSGCTVTEVRPQESVQIKLSKSVAEGTTPCKMQIFADSELVFDLKTENTQVKCPLPNFVALPEDVDAGSTDASEGVDGE